MMGFHHEVHLKIFTNCQPKERELRAFGYSSDERYGQMARGVVIFIPCI